MYDIEQVQPWPHRLSIWSSQKSAERAGATRMWSRHSAGPVEGVEVPGLVFAGQTLRGDQEGPLPHRNVLPADALPVAKAKAERGLTLKQV